MPTLTRPGVYVDQSQFPTYATVSPGVAVAAFVGQNPRGPVSNGPNAGSPNQGPTIVNSWRDFVANFGGFDTAFPPSPLALALFTYFMEGGTSAIICRSVSTSDPPATASHTFDDRASTPQPTLTLSAANPGAWGSKIYIDILDGTVMGGTPAVAQTFTLQVKYGGTGQANLVERFENLTMVPGSTTLGQNNYAIDVINSSISGSKYITAQAIDQSQLPGKVVDPPPTNNPANQSGFQLPGGSDGAIPGGTPPSNVDLQAAMQMLDQYPDRPLVLNLPGVSDPTGIGNAIAYAEGRQDVFVVVDCGPGQDPKSMAAFANGLSASPQAAIYYPQVKITDPYSPTAGHTRLVPPGGFVTGLYVKTDNARGVAKAPAGLAASLQGAQGLELTISNVDLGNLTQAKVNCIVSVPGSGIVVWGARTLSPYLVTRYVSVSRSLIYLVTNFIAMTKFAVFEPNDWVLWNQVTQILSQFLTSFWQSGGLAGNAASQAYYVICDASNNTASSILNGIVNVEVGVALQRPAEFVVVKLGQWAGGQSLQVVAA